VWGGCGWGLHLGTDGGGSGEELTGAAGVDAAVEVGEGEEDEADDSEVGGPLGADEGACREDEGGSGEQERDACGGDEEHGEHHAEGVEASDGHADDLGLVSFGDGEVRVGHDVLPGWCVERLVRAVGLSLHALWVGCKV